MLTLFAIFTRKPKRKKKITVTKLPSGEGELTPVFLNPERAEEFAKNYLKLNPKKVGEDLGRDSDAVRRPSTTSTSSTKR